jgi:tripartite-type tricarboxylate transporter receptor subunit TctC
VLRLNAEVKRVLALPDVKQRFTDLGMSLGGGTPSELDIYIKKSSRRPKFERPTNTML